MVYLSWGECGSDKPGSPLRYTAHTAGGGSLAPSPRISRSLSRISSLEGLNRLNFGRASAVSGYARQNIVRSDTGQALQASKVRAHSGALKGKRGGVPWSECFRADTSALVNVQTLTA